MLGTKRWLPRWVDAILCLCLFLGLGGCATTAPLPDLTPASVIDTPATEGRVPVAPILRLDTGGHTAAVRRIDIDAKERYLVTGSDDKLVRVWSLADGTLLHTLRIPIDQGNGGKVFAVAISPGGQIVAAGGWTKWDWDVTHSIYLFERVSGRMMTRLGGFPNAIDHLTFSHDGHFLVANLRGANGIRVYRTSEWTKFA